jgi:aminomuconate-semialdehyde/2-hydroxymuconate-6-semialdehyde dehydrogenase
VVTISKFKNLDDAIAKANDSIYGLSASAWTQNLTAAHRLARELHVGTLWINSWLTRDLKTPFGGMKASGIGREGGEHSIDFFTESTSVNVKLF